MKLNFQAPSRIFFKFMVEQCKALLTVNCYCVSKFQKQIVKFNYKKQEFYNRLESKKSGYLRESAKRINFFAQ